MNESAEAAGLATKPQLDNYYRWVEPDSDITVYLKLEAMDRLQLEILRGIRSVLDAGNEVGGILLGRMEFEEGRTLTFVDDFEPVPCDQRNSPAYALTGKEAVNFEAVLARRRARRSPRVVGYCRSHNRDGLFLSEDDLRIIHRHFHEPDNLFLLIKTLANRTCTAGFFFWKDGHIQSEFTDSEAPLIPVSLSSVDRSLLSKEAGREVPVAPPVPAPAELARGRNVRRRLIRGMAVTGVAAAVTLAVVRYRETGPRDQTPTAPQPVPVAAATSAPPVPPPLPVPTPVQEPSPVVTQSADTPQSRSATVLPQTRNVPAPPFRGEPKPATPAPAPEMPAVHSQVASDAGGPPPAKPLTALAERPPNTAPPSPAATTAAPPAPVTPAPKPESPAPLPIASPPADVVPPIGTPAPPAPAAPPSAPAAPPASATAHTFVGPQIIHQVTPAVPRGVGPMIATDVQVDVAVAIDANGKVTAARVAATKGTAAGLLTIEALKAAQLFRFQPARENGRNVASSMVLTFRFARTAK